MFKLFRSALMAGITIGVAGFGFLASGVQSEVYGTVVGAILFSFGLLTVLGYKMALYTGTAGFIKKNEVGNLLVILLSNILGCLLLALLSRFSILDIQAQAQKVLQLRMNTGALSCGFLAIGCGFIMTTTVAFARKGNIAPLLLGVPLFIVCGFPHCVADAFIFLAAPFDFLGANVWTVLPLYLCIVLGNFVGCNLYRIVLDKSHYSA